MPKSNLKHVEFVDSKGKHHSFVARKNKRSGSRGSPKRPLNVFAKLVKQVNKETGLYGPALFKAAKKVYRSRD